MQYAAEHLARMNRSGQRAGAVGSKPTRVTRMVLKLAEEGYISRNEGVFDFGAGREARQTAILRDAGFGPVIPYDVGENGHGTDVSDMAGCGVVMLSNVLNVQDSVESVRRLLAMIRRNLQQCGVLVCNLPREPRYGNITKQDVTDALHSAGFDIKRQEGECWVALSPRQVDDEFQGK